MKRRRLELPRHNCHYPLKVARLPIPPPLQHLNTILNICAQDRTRTCTLKNTRTWNVRVYQFRHLGLNSEKTEVEYFLFERKTGLGPATPTLARLCSTNWAISACSFSRSEEEETRTPTTQLSLPPQSSASTNSATSPFSKTPYSKQNSCCFKMLSGKRDSDPRPQPWQGCALPTELFPLIS